MSTMADRGEVAYDDGARGQSKRGKRKRKNKRSRISGEHHSSVVSGDDDSHNMDDTLDLSPDSHKDDMPEADRANSEKESETQSTPEAERVEDLPSDPDDLTSDVPDADLAKNANEDHPDSDIYGNYASLENVGNQEEIENDADEFDNFIEDIETEELSRPSWGEEVEAQLQAEGWPEDATYYMDNSNQYIPAYDNYEYGKENAEAENGGYNAEPDAEDNTDAVLYDNEPMPEDSDGISMELDAEGRVDLYEKAALLMKRGKKDLALRCFLRCLTGLKENSGFVYLPQCLHSIADIYYEKEEFDKAIQFIHAEKVYYETALINTSQKQKVIEAKKRIKIDEDGEVVSNAETVKADEYENLARLCLDKNQPQLALEYQGKATKIRQQVYGQDHPITANSLDYFTVIYGEVGKQLYSESMQKASEEPLIPGDLLSHIEVEAASELRNRKKAAQMDTSCVSEKDIAENQECPITQAVFESDSLEIQSQETGVSGTVLWIMFFIFTLVLSVIVFYVYCQWDTQSRSCIAWKSDLHYYYMKLKYLYYSYFHTGDS